MPLNSFDTQSTWVIPEQLHRARASLGLTLEQAAEKIGVLPDDLRDWEGGRVGPPLPGLRRLSAVYKRSIRFFLVHEETQSVIDYRLVPAEKRTMLSTEAREALIDFEDLCRRSWELEQILETPSEPRLQQAQLTEDFEELAVRERTALREAGLTVTAPPSSRSTVREVLLGYRNAIESLGIKVFALQLPVPEVRGASWWHPEYGPAILLSQRDWTAPRLFTLAHEFGHIILRESGTPVCDLRGEVDVERFANRFSASLLVPADAFWDRLRTRGWVDREAWDDAALGSLAGTFKVSRDVIAIRLEELGLAASGFYRLKRAEWDQQVPTFAWRSRVGRRPGWQIHIEDALGPRYEGLVLSAFREGHLTWADLTRYLGLRVEELQRWLDYKDAQVT